MARKKRASLFENSELKILEGGTKVFGYKAPDVGNLLKKCIPLMKKKFGVKEEEEDDFYGFRKRKRTKKHKRLTL